MAYDTWRGSWRTSWGLSWTRGNTPTPDTHDGGLDQGHYKKYRKRLERLAKLAEQHNQSKYVQIAAKTAEIADELQVSLPEVVEAAATEQVTPEYDFSALQAGIMRIQKYLDDLIAVREQEEEDETIIMMALS